MNKKLVKKGRMNSDQWSRSPILRQFQGRDGGQSILLNETAQLSFRPVLNSKIARNKKPTSSLSQARLIISSWIRSLRLNFLISSLRLAFCWGK